MTTIEHIYNNITHTVKIDHGGAIECLTANIKLDKDQYECCVCMSSMTGHIYNCKSNHTRVSHNICGDCDWQLRRMKKSNLHTKEQECPICKTQGEFTRNTVLEKKLKVLSLPCQHEKKGCEFRFFPWDDFSKEEHEKVCMYEPVTCVFCKEDVPGGRINFVEHLLKSNPDNSNVNCNNTVKGCKILFKEIRQKTKKFESFVLSRTDNFYVVNYEQGIVLCFLAPTDRDPCWKCYAISVSPHHDMCGNNSIYLQYFNEEETENYFEFERERGIHFNNLQQPNLSQLQLTVGRLIPSYFNKNSADALDLEYVTTKYSGSSPCTPMQIGHIFGGVKNTECFIERLKCRMYTLEEQFKLGGTIEARDHTGRWYQAEIIQVLNVKNTKRAKIHYLGFSAKYDEWLNVDSDSHRIAHFGTFTVGPDVRTMRRHARKPLLGY